MANTRYNVSYQGLLTVYTSSTGLTDVRTGLAELGGGMQVGDYVDFTEDEAQSLSTNLHQGRYRFVKLLAAATAANIVQGAPVGIAPGGSVESIAIVTAGSGQTAGTYTITATGGTFTVAATAQVVVGSAGTVISATVLNGGAYTTTTAPTFTVAAGGTPGTVAAQFKHSPNVVTSFDASAITLNQARGVFMASVTAAQVTAGAYVYIQELGDATVLVTTATDTAVGDTAYVSASGGAVTTNVPTAYHAATLGYTLAISAAATLVPVRLTLPVLQG